MEDQYLKTDVLIIGGGVAGLNAALSAREAGQDVVIMDKAVIKRSGHAAGGIDHFCAYLNTGPEWDTREAYLEFTAKSARGAADLSVVEKVYCDELETAIKRFDDIGCTLRRPDGSFFRTQSFGQPGPWWINFNGKRLKPLLTRAVKRAGCTVLERVVTSDLLVYDGEVCGAAGFDIRKGTFYVVQAKAVIMLTGGTNRLFQNPTGLSFNCWMCPANTGDGEAMALRAGAELANVEYLRMTLVPRGFSAPGLNALVGMGAKLVNGAGEEFMKRYHPLGMKGPRYTLVQGVLGELKAHRGPVYVDCRHIDPESLKHLVTTLSYDKDTYGDFLEQKGIDLSRDLMEIATSEGMQGGPNEVCGSGIKIGPDCETTVPGLFSAGNSADQCRSLHMAVTGGIHSGKTSARYAGKKTGKEIPLPKNRVREIRERIFAPMAESRSVSWQEFEDVLQRTLAEGMGPTRSAWTMEKALNNLDLLEDWKDRVGAASYHDLCRTQEVYNMLTVARCMISAALFRKESRFGLCHNRLDFPETDDNRWLGQVTVRIEDGEKVRTVFFPIKYK
ncbi:MAG: FAD-binding protein [Deltaproteobacteria bacterium]|nr:FAD-binding protein [Deltaproteobacteria bacterium]MBW2305085.1 FAD-binding protein [Deltaproteobacteria bacterium]